MPACPARIVATLLACAGTVVAADQPKPLPRDITRDYTYEELLAGKDIQEGISFGLHAGEFDEWRLHIGTVPGIDQVQVKTSIDGSPYPGPISVETDKVVNGPPVGTTLQAEWILGDFDNDHEGWFYSLGFEYYERTYKILYAVGANSPDLRMIATGVNLGMGYAWYLSPTVRYELEPRLTVGLVWNQIDLLDLELATQDSKIGSGPYIEACIRQALVWHPGRTQGWHLGLALDWRLGYAQTSYRTETALGNTDSEVRLFWAGFGTSLFYGQRF